MYKCNDRISSKILEVPSTKTINFSHKELSSHFDETYVDLILNFISTIKRKNPNWDFNILYNNLSTLSFKESHILTSLNRTDSYYDWETNTIYYQTFSNLFHQLLHVSTLTKKDGVYICGLEQADLRRFFGYTIGIGLNEGATYYIESIYASPFRWHLLEGSIVRNIDKLDKGSIEKLYNKMDLLGFITFLKQYESEKDVLDFLQKLDYVNLHQGTESTRKIKEVLDLYYECQVFAYRCYIYKLLKDIQDGVLDFDKANSKLRLMISLSESKLLFRGNILDINRLDSLGSNAPDLEHISKDDIARFKLMI